MSVFDKFEIAFSKLISLIEVKDFQSIMKIDNLYQDLGSISNIEMYYNLKSQLIINLSEDNKKKLILVLTDLDKTHFENREKNWYFANLYNMIFNSIYNSINCDNRQYILDYILKNRKNDRIPFAKDLDLDINSYEKFVEFPLKKFKNYQVKQVCEYLFDNEL